MSRKLHNPKSFAPAVYIPCWLLQVPNKLLSYAAKLLYGRLSQWSNEKGDVFRSYHQLAHEMGSTKRSVSDYISELKKVGLIDSFQPQAGGLNHFIFYDHDWMHMPINEYLCYKSEPDPTQDSAHPPTQNPALPHAESCATPTQNPARINKKEIKRNTTTTKPAVPVQKSHSEPVVVSSSFSKNPKTQKDKCIESLTHIYEDHAFTTPEILDLDDFLSAAMHLLDNRGDRSLNERLKGIKSLVQQNKFDGSTEWIQKRIKEKNRKKGEANQKRIEEEAEKKAALILKPVNTIKSKDASNQMLANLTGNKNYKEDKKKQEQNQKEAKKILLNKLDGPKKPFRRIRLPEELRANA